MAERVYLDPVIVALVGHGNTVYGTGMRSLDTGASPNISVRLPVPLKEWLAGYARRHGHKDMSHAVRSMIEKTRDQEASAQH